MNSKKIIGTLLGIPAVFMIVALIVPVGYMVILTFSKNVRGGVEYTFTLENVARFFEDSYYVKNVLWLSIKMGLISAVLSLLFGYPIAYFIARTESERVKTILLILTIIPLWINVVVRTLAWQILLADNGLIVSFLHSIGFADAKLASSEIGTLIGLTQISIPYVVLPLMGVIESLPVALEESAYSVGASPFRTFIHITFPLSMQGVISGVLTVFAINAGAYSIPQMLGGGKVRMLSVVSYEQAMASGNFPFASCLGLILLLTSMIIVIFSQKISDKMSLGK